MTNIIARVVQEEGVHAFGGQVSSPKAICVLRMNLWISQGVTTSLNVSDHDVPGCEFPSEVCERLRQVRIFGDVASIGGELLIPT